MPDQKINEYVDRPAIVEDTEFLKERLKEVMQVFEKLIELKNKFQVGGSAKNQSSDTKNAIDELEKLAKQKKKFLDEDLQLSKAQVQQDEALIKSKKALTLADSEAAKETAKNKYLIQQRNAELKNQAREELAVKGSIEQQRAALIRLQKEYDNIGPLQRSTNQGKNLQKTIKDMSTELLALEKATGRSQRNVGNYGESLQTLERYLADVRSQLQQTSEAQASAGILAARKGPPNPGGGSPVVGDRINAADLQKYNQTLQQSADKVKQLSIQEEALTRIVNSQIAGYASVGAQIKAQTVALDQLKAAGVSVHDEVYQRLLKDTAELKDAQGDLKDEIKALASDTRGIDLFVGSVNGLTQALTVGASIAELAAGANEDVAESIRRLEAFQNIAMGVQNLSNELTTRGTALNKLYNFVVGDKAKATKIATIATETETAATEAGIVATEGMTLATKVLRGALVGLGIGALVIAVGYLLGKLDEWKQDTKDLTDLQIQLNKTLLEQRNLQQEITDLTTNDTGTRTRDLQNQLDLARAYGKTQEEILANELKLLTFARDQANITFFDTGGDTALQKFEDTITDIVRKLNELKSNQLNSDYSLPQEQFDKQKELLESQLALAKSVYSEQRKVVDDYYNANRALILKEEELRKLRAENARRDLAAELAIFKIRKQAVIDYNKTVSEAPLFGYQGQLIAREKAFEAEKAIILKQKAFELSEEGLTRNEKKLIRVKADDDERKARERLYDDLLQITATFRQREQEQLAADAALAADLPEAPDQDAILQARFEKRRAFLQEGSDIVVASIERERTAKLKAANSDEERARIEEKYNDKRARKEIETAALILKANIELAEAKLKISGLNPNQLAELEAEIARLKLALAELAKQKVDIDIDEAKEKLDKLAKGIENIGKVLNGAFDAIGNQLAAQAERRQQDNEDQINAIDKKKDADLEALDQTALSEKDKAREKARIEKIAANEKEQIALKERRAKLQEARFEKARAIAEAVTQGALSVIAGLRTGGPVLAAIYAAIAAVQIAAVIAAPLPRYKLGKKAGGPGHWAITGDGGQSEVMYSKDRKKLFLTPDKETLTYVPDEYGIAPSVSAFNQMIAAEGHKPRLKAVRGGLLADQGAVVVDMRREIEGIKRQLMASGDGVHYHFTERGLFKTVQKVGLFEKHIQNSI